MFVRHRAMADRGRLGGCTEDGLNADIRVKRHVDSDRNALKEPSSFEIDDGAIAKTSGVNQLLAGPAQARASQLLTGRSVLASEAGAAKMPAGQADLGTFLLSSRIRKLGQIHLMVVSLHA